MNARRAIRLLTLSLLLLPTVSFTRTSSPPETVIQATGRGNPWINLQDGHVLPADYSGPQALVMALESKAVSPRALASADFDEDGVPDLVASYALASGGGLVTLSRGNVDAIYPNALEAKARKAAGTWTPEPFLPDVAAFPTPETPDLVFAGDFDADGHRDVVAAKVSGKALQFLKGDGKGNLSEAGEIDLPGTVTAMTVGEINRRDGLDDIVVGVETPEGPQALVFEWPGGALEHEPEVISLPHPATSMVLGPMDESFPRDLAVAAKEQLVFVPGRDRWLRMDRNGRSMAPGIQTFPILFHGAIRSLALGHFSQNSRLALAILSDGGEVSILPTGPTLRESVVRPVPWVTGVSLNGANTRLLRAKVSSMPGDDLVIVDDEGSTLAILPPRGISEVSTAATMLDTHGGRCAVLPMRLSADALTDLVMLCRNSSAPAVATTSPLAIFTVTNTNDSGAGSLRQAITDANGNSGSDTVTFNIPGTAVHTIMPLTPLPEITEPMLLDATTQPGYGGSPAIELDGTLTPFSPTRNIAFGFMVSAAATTIRGFAINRFTASHTGGPFGAGILMGGADTTGSIIEGNMIGTSPDGMTALGNGWNLELSNDVQDVLIGGTTTAARNVIAGAVSGETTYPSIVQRVTVQGNYVGTNATGSLSLEAGGEAMTCSFEGTIGGNTAGAGNLISGNTTATDWPAGIRVGVPGCVIQGNRFGTDATGTVPIGNRIGIDVASSGTTIGGVAGFPGISLGARNVISGNLVEGIKIRPGANDNIIQGNFIGLDISGDTPLANLGDGLSAEDSGNNLIGGILAGTPNYISGNLGQGILIQGPMSASNRIVRNVVGASLSGTAGNGDNGIKIVGAPSSEILTNAVSGNTGNGIVLRFADSTLIAGNFVGVSPGGLALPNNGSGIVLQGSNACDIGGNTAGDRNVISGNALAGILLSEGADGNFVRGNYIGTDPLGGVPVPNGDAGAAVIDSAANMIGGSLAGELNLISGNIGPGVEILTIGGGMSSSGNIVRGNRIGTDVSGTEIVGNGIGVDLQGAPGTQVGGTGAGYGNLISGNGIGVIIGPGSNGSVLQGNRIGTDLSGLSALPNLNEGILVASAGSVIGGSAAGAGNVVSGNAGTGILVGFTMNTLIEGNIIGGNVTGTIPLGNDLTGVTLLDATNCTIADNLISANARDGLQITGASSGNVLRGNRIGIGADLSVMGNVRSGVRVTGGASNNVVGEPGASANIIANNGLNGIDVISGTGNALRFNSIHDNAMLGIDLGSAGVAMNDFFDADTGANGLQNFPALTAARTDSLNLYLDGSLHSVAGRVFTIDVYRNPACDPAGNGEGQNYLGGFLVTTSGVTGSVTFSQLIPGSVAIGEVITATATDTSGNTSEFSGCVTVSRTPRMVASLEWSAGSMHQLEWLPLQEAISYRLYAGGISLAPALLTQANDSCERTLTQSSMTGPSLLETPGLNHVYYYLVTAIDQNNVEGLAGEATAGLRQVNSPGECGTSCAHNKCSAGGPIDPACDPCVAQVCAVDSSCCGANGWGQQCADMVLSVCNNVSCLVPPGQCGHSLCKTGIALQAGCDQGAITPSCVDRVCQADPKCCQQSWSQACVEAVSTVCTLNCN